MFDQIIRVIFPYYEYKKIIKNLKETFHVNTVRS